MASELFIPKVGPLPQQREIGGKSPLEKGGPAFDRLLKDSLAPGATPGPAAPAAPAAGLKFSAHALSRIRDRSISMGGDLMARLEKAVDTAASKGAKESLILSDDAAFIVSVKNKTVITVVDRNNMNNNVFTNIDSTVVI
jgi:flagellar operon protein